MNYEVKTQPQEGQNEFDTVISMTGLHSDVTINSLLDHLEMTKRTMKEQEGQVMANRMIMEKAVERLPILKDIPDDKVGEAFSYINKLVANKQSEDLINTCKHTIETYETHLKGIQEATGIVCLPELSPIQPEDKTETPE